MDDIQLGYDSNKEYNLAERVIHLDNLDVFDMSDIDQSPTTLLDIQTRSTAIASQTIKHPNILNNLCILYVENKSTKVIRQNKSMTALCNKLEEIHANLWRPHDLPS